jgi:hypothetical protein
VINIVFSARERHDPLVSRSVPSRSESPQLRSTDLSGLGRLQAIGYTAVSHTWITDSRAASSLLPLEPYILPQRPPTPPLDDDDDDDCEDSEQEEESVRWEWKDPPSLSTIQEVSDEDRLDDSGFLERVSQVKKEVLSSPLNIGQPFSSVVALTFGMYQARLTVEVR